MIEQMVCHQKPRTNRRIKHYAHGMVLTAKADSRSMEESGKLQTSAQRAGNESLARLTRAAFLPALVSLIG